VIVDSDIQVRALVPMGAATGPVSATNAAGTGASPEDFEVIPVPEPSHTLLLGAALASVALLARRPRRAATPSSS
jgi:hypothetical protein